MGEIAIGAGTLDLGAQFGIVELDERRTARHGCALPEEQLRHSPRRVGAQVDLLDRLDLAGRDDGVDNRVGERSSNFHRKRRTFTARRTASGGAVSLSPAAPRDKRRGEQRGSRCDVGSRQAPFGVIGKS